MQVAAIESHSSDVNFGKKKKQTPLDQASKFVNMSDNQLREIAYEYSYNPQEEQKQKKTLNKFFFAIPIVDTIARGVLTEKVPVFDKKLNIIGAADASLGAKALISANAAGNWAACIAVIGLYSAIKNGVTKNSPGAKEFEQKHPVLSFMGDISIVLGGLMLGNAGVNKFFEKRPEAIKIVITKMKDMVESVNKSKINTELLPKIIKNIEKADQAAPTAMKVGRFALANSMFIILGAALVKMFNFAKENNQKVENNYQILKDQQSNIAKHVINNLNIKSDILAHQNKILAKELGAARIREAILIDAHTKALQNASKAEAETIEQPDEPVQAPVGTADEAPKEKHEKMIIIYEK